MNFDPDEVWELETLHFAPAPSNSGVHRIEIDLWLRDAILNAYGIRPSPSGRRIFVSRSQITNRRLVNENAVIKFLQSYGFDVVSPEALDLRGQAELFAEAEMVVSTHGSAFTNMLFAPPGLVVIDMLDPSMFTNAFTFWAMSEALGHEYWYFVIDNVEVPGIRWPDTRVPIDKLAETFAQIGLAPKS